MSRFFRNSLVAISAAALLSTQAYAAPAMSRAALDPLVTLSVLGTAQSRAAVCAAGASAAAAGAATLALQGPAAGCLLPLTDPPPPPVQTTAPAPLPPPPPPAPGKQIGWWPIILGGVLAGVLLWLILDDDDKDRPVSPA